MLVVEDDTELAATLALGLRQQGIATDLAGHGDQALDRLALVAYDVVVLDRDCPACTATRSPGRSWPTGVPAGC